MGTCGRSEVRTHDRNISVSLALVWKYFPRLTKSVKVFRRPFRPLEFRNLGLLPVWEPLYCSALTGKCTRCVKECLCLSLALPPSNPTFQSRHERGLFIGFFFFFFSRKKRKKKKTKCLSNLHSWTWKCSGASLLAFLLVLLSCRRSLALGYTLLMSLPLSARTPADFRVSPRFPCQAIFLGFSALAVLVSLSVSFIHTFCSPFISFTNIGFFSHTPYLVSFFSAKASDILLFPNSIHCFSSAVWHLRDCVESTVGMFALVFHHILKK